MGSGGDLKKLLGKVAGEVSARLSKEVSDKLFTYSRYAPAEEGIEWISTGNAAIDRILGGGIPISRVIEIFGPFSGGKSLLCYEIIAEVQRRDGIAALIDTENAYDDRFGARIGIDNDALLYSRPDTVEDVFDIIETTIKTVRRYDQDRLIAIFWDSLAQTSTRQEMREPDKPDMTKARLLSSKMRRSTRLIGKGRNIFVVVNQIREKIGVMFGNPETTPGGNAVPFAASVRLRVQQGSLYKGHEKKIRDGGKVIGNRIVVDCVKNKVGNPFRKCEAIISFQDGLISWSGLADLHADEATTFMVDGKVYTVERVEKQKNLFKLGNRQFKGHQIEEVLKDVQEII